MFQQRGKREKLLDKKILVKNKKQEEKKEIFWRTNCAICKKFGGGNIKCWNTEQIYSKIFWYLNIDIEYRNIEIFYFFKYKKKFNLNIEKKIFKKKITKNSSMIVK